MTIAVMMLSNVSSIYAEESHDTTVSYNNSEEIGNDPEWAVLIPTSISIDDKNPSKSFTVEAISKVDGQEITDLLNGKKVSISISSKNSFELKYKNADPVEYELDKTAMELTAAKTSDTATVTLKGIAKQTGDHSDVLTFAMTTTTE